MTTKGYETLSTLIIGIKTTVDQAKEELHLIKADMMNTATELTEDWPLFEPLKKRLEAVIQLLEKI